MSLLKIMRAVLIGILIDVILIGGAFLYTMPKNVISNDEVRGIYRNLLSKTGQSQDSLPLIIINDSIINAYTNGRAVYVYRGIINFADNKDEIALILGHEIAHNMLRHTYYSNFRSSSLETSVAEANADKMGAYYIMRAGYNLCAAREIWKKMQQNYGDYQGGDHPTFIYRYDQLNMNCTKY